MTRYSLGALVAAGLLAGGMSVGASAADLGGDCCADLEERVAELEATTARKGNRKVSLTISGFVAQQVMAWDDGDESNIYITDTGSVSIGTHFKFSGEAVIVPGWTAGYVLKVEAITTDSLLVDQFTDDGIATNAMSVVGNGANSPLALESSYWFVKSESMGRLSVGRQSSAADNQAILPDGSGSLVQANYVMYDVNAFFVRNEDEDGDAGLSNLRIGDTFANCAPLNNAGGVGGDCDGYPNENIRYDTPTFAGFSASASWGEDDVWAVSGRYAGEWSGFKVAAAIAYNESTDENGPGGFGTASADPLDAAALQVGAYVQHVPTGLFLYGAYAEEYIDEFGAAEDKPEGDMWYLKAGVRQRWMPLGHTVLYGEYGEKEDLMSADAFLAGITETELTQYGLGVVQEIDAAAMSVWLSWRHYEFEATCSDDFGTCGTGVGLGGNIDVGDNDFEDFDIVKAGALISF